MINVTRKRTTAIASVIATSLLAVLSPASATSPVTLTPKQLIAFTIPKQQPEASVNASLLESSIDSIVSTNQVQYKNTDDRRQLLVKQRHRDHEMFIVGTGDCRFIGYTRIRGLNPHSAPLNWHIRCSIG
jgi:hypothetical protein